MKRVVGVVILLVLATVSLSLAKAPKPMACDSFKCGPKCAPAKYVSVRFPPTVRPLFESQVYGAAVVEGGAGFLVAVGGV
ncbi:MAG: hypothetical protein ABI968_07200, partial [Acidobacteriota bacterium]